MSALPAPDFAPLDEDYMKHALKLVKAQHCAYPVLFEGKECFVQVVNSRLTGGRVETDVWLSGNPIAVAPDAITVPASKA